MTREEHDKWCERQSGRMTTTMPPRPNSIARSARAEYFGHLSFARCRRSRQTKTDKQKGARDEHVIVLSGEKYVGV